jgi:hypothetical protein
LIEEQELQQDEKVGKIALGALIEGITAYPDRKMEVKFRIGQREEKIAGGELDDRHGGTHITSDNFSAQKIRCQNGVTGLLSVAGFWRCQSTSRMQYFSGCD